MQAVVPPSLAEQLRSRAGDERRSVSQVIRFAIEDSLHLRDFALLNAMHPGAVLHREEEVDQTDPPNFDGGVRGDAFNAPRPEPSLRRRPQTYREPGGWHTFEIEDGAELFFGQLGER